MNITYQLKLTNQTQLKYSLKGHLIFNICYHQILSKCFQSCNQKSIDITILQFSVEDLYDQNSYNIDQVSLILIRDHYFSFYY